jgi:hypothetical protein
MSLPPPTYVADSHVARTTPGFLLWLSGSGGAASGGRPQQMMRQQWWLLLLVRAAQLLCVVSAPSAPSCACNNIPAAGARAACCQRQHTRCRLVPAANNTGFPLGLCVPRQPKPPPHLVFERCNSSDQRQQWDAAPFSPAGAKAPIRNRAHGQCVSTRDERRQPGDPATGPYHTATVIWAHAPAVVVEAAECDRDGSTFTYDAARRTLAVMGFESAQRLTPFGRGIGSCLDVVSLNGSASASTDM